MFKKALKITNDNILVIAPLVLFSLAINLYASYAYSHADTLSKAAVGIIVMICIFGVFAGGVFNVIRKIVDISKNTEIIQDKTFMDIRDLFRCIIEGIGQYFFSFTSLYLILLILEFVFIPSLVILGVVLFGNIPVDLLNAIKSFTGTGLAALGSVLQTHLHYILKWLSYTLLLAFICTCLILFWIPEIVYKTKNPIIALFTSIKKVFSKIKLVVCIISFIFVINLFLLFVLILVVKSNVLYLLFEFVRYYFYAYCMILIFSSYDKEFNSAPAIAGDNSVETNEE